MLSNRSMPAATVIPVLVYEDVPDAVEWLCDTFGFREHERVGDYWAYLAIGEGAVILRGRRVASALRTSDPVMLRPPRRGEVSHTIMVRVDDVDAHYRRAPETGARILRPRTTLHQPTASGAKILVLSVNDASVFYSPRLVWQLVGDPLADRGAFRSSL